MSDSESEYWAQKLGLRGEDTAKAKRKLEREFDQLDGLGAEFLNLFSFMDEIKKTKKKSKKSATDFIADEVTDSAAETGKYIPPHRRGRGQVGIQKATTASTSLVGLLNRVCEGNLDSVYDEIISLVKKTRLDHTYLSEQLLNVACNNHNITITLQGTMAAVVCAIASDTGPSNRYSLSILVDLVRRIKSLSASTEPTSNRAMVIHVRFLAVLFSFGLFPIDVVRSYLNFCLSTRVSLETKLEWILVMLRFSGRVLKDQFKDRFAAILRDVNSAFSDYNSVTKKEEFLMKELQAMNQSNFRAIDHLRTACDWLTIRSERTNARLHASANSSISQGWRIPKSVEKVQLVMPVRDIFVDDLGSIVVESIVDVAVESGANAATTDATATKSLEDLARLNRMTTEQKKHAFMALMGSVDANHAVMRLDQFGLVDKPKEVPTVVGVLCHCALQEKSGNPFYGHLLRLLAGGGGGSIKLEESIMRKFKISFKIELKKLISSGDLATPEVQIVSNLVSQLLSVSEYKLEDFFS